MDRSWNILEVRGDPHCIDKRGKRSEGKDGAIRQIRRTAAKPKDARVSVAFEKLNVEGSAGEERVSSTHWPAYSSASWKYPSLSVKQKTSIKAHAERSMTAVFLFMLLFMT